MTALIRDKKVLVERFNENYINIVEISSGNKPSALRNYEDNAQSDVSVYKFISKYSSPAKKLKGIFSR